MLKSIQISNFKNVKEASVNFNSMLTGIYGPNASGKTTIIELIELLIADYHYCERRSKIKFDDHDPIKEYINCIRENVSKGSSQTSYQFNFTTDAYDFVISKNFSIGEKVISYVENIDYKVVNSRGKYKPFYEKSLEPENNSDFLMYKLFNREENLTYSIENMESALKPLSIFKNIVDDIDIQKLSENERHVFDSFESLMYQISNAFIITLKEQSLPNLGYSIPLRVHSTIEGREYSTLIPLIQDKSIYDEADIEILKKTISSISSILQHVSPNKKLELNIVNEKLGNEGMEYAINVNTITNGVEINVEKESSGIIKLISIIANLIDVVNSRDAIVIIDELDAHIFEYLLSKMVKTINALIKGQFIFTSHNLTLFETLKKQNIILACSNDGVIQFDTFKKVNPTENMRNKYIRLQLLDDDEVIKSSNISENKIMNAFMLAQLESEL